MIDFYLHFSKLYNHCLHVWYLEVSTASQSAYRKKKEISKENVTTIPKVVKHDLNET